jgi:hypothetical protein
MQEDDRREAGDPPSPVGIALSAGRSLLPLVGGRPAETGESGMYAWREALLIGDTPQQPAQRLAFIRRERRAD